MEKKAKRSKEMQLLMSMLDLEQKIISYNRHFNCDKYGYLRAALLATVPPLYDDIKLPL